MPLYSYICNKCKTKFEIFCSIKDYQDQPNCRVCDSKNTDRAYIDDMRTIFSSVKKGDNELSTLGDLASRNSDKMSNDQKAELLMKHNSYKEQSSNKELPKGMSRIKKPKTKIKWRES